MRLDLDGLAAASCEALMAEGKFPRPVKIGRRAVGWVEEDINNWLSNKITQQSEQWSSGCTMPKSYASKQRKRGKDQFVVIYHFMADTVVWRTLKPAPRALYLEIKRQYKGYYNGRVLLSYRDAAERLNSNYSSVGNWFEELEKRGFLVCLQRPHLGPSGVGQKSHWRLTEYEYDGRKATHEYRIWKPKKN